MQAWKSAFPQAPSLFFSKGKKSDKIEKENSQAEKQELFFTTEHEKNRDLGRDFVGVFSMQGNEDLIPAKWFPLAYSGTGKIAWSYKKPFRAVAPIGTAFPKCGNVPSIPWINPTPRETFKMQGKALAFLDSAYSITEKNGDVFSGATAIDRTAKKIAWLQGRFQRNGGKGKGEIITSGKDKGFFTIKMRDGNGLNVESELLENMELAARASLFANLLGGVIPSPEMLFRLAKNSAERERHNATREQTFADMEKAIQSKDKAFFTLYPGIETITSGQAQPEKTEFLGLNAGIVQSLKTGFAKARRALVARASVQSSNSAQADMRKQTQNLRVLCGEIYRGDITRGLWRDDSARNLKLARLAARVAEGNVILALQGGMSERGNKWPMQSPFPSCRKSTGKRALVQWGILASEVREENLAVYPLAKRILAKRTLQENLADLQAHFSLKA